MKTRFGYDAALTYSPPRSSGPGFGALLRALAKMPQWRAPRWREQGGSLHLNEHLLQDMGLDRSHAQQPAVRPYWRA